jgi:hypothetical protein
MERHRGLVKLAIGGAAAAGLGFALYGVASAIIFTAPLHSNRAALDAISGTERELDLASLGQVRSDVLQHADAGRAAWSDTRPTRRIIVVAAPAAGLAQTIPERLRRAGFAVQADGSWVRLIGSRGDIDVQLIPAAAGESVSTGDGANQVVVPGGTTGEIVEISAAGNP